MSRDDDPQTPLVTRHEDSVTTPLDVVLSERDDSEAERLRPNDVLAGRFSIRQWVASGGMGDVYRAYDRELDGEVAIKTIRRAIVSEVRAMERFRREISLARQVTHANVCRVFDIFHQASVTRSEATFQRQDGAAPGAVTFLTMELLDGPTLSEWLAQQGTLPPELALPIVEHMVAGLEAAHEVGVIHRDFKCSNVILCLDDSGGRRAVVTDFGLARRFLEDHDPSTEITAQGEIVGSPAYMAPEQILGDQLTPATDVFALGVVLFRMVCGRLPFQAHGTMEVLAQRLHRDAPRPREVVPGLDLRWDTAIHQCLARDPEFRLASPRHLLWALATRPTDTGTVVEAPSPSAGAMDGSPFDSPQPASQSTSSQSTSRQVFSRRWWPWGLVALIGLAVLGLWRLEDRGTAPENANIESSVEGNSVAVLGFKNLSRRDESEWLAIALTELLTTELAGDGQVRVVPADDVAEMRQELGLVEIESLAADTLQRIRLRLGSRYVVSGSYFVTGPRGSDSLRLDVRLQETEVGAAIQGLSETAPQEKLLDLVQRVGHQLRPRLTGSETATKGATAGNLGIGPGVPEGATMPSSLEATRLYVQGLHALRHFDGLRARDLLLEAEALDGDFPLILEALAGAYGMLGYDLEAREKIRRAHELSGGLTLRERRHIEGAYREWNADWQGAGEIYRTLFELFPDRLDYGLDLVRVQIEGGQRQEAESTLAQLRALPAPDREDPRIDLKEVEHALSIGLYPRAIEAAERVIEKGERIGSRLLVARTQMHLSLAFWRLDRLQSAQDTVRQAQKTFLELEDRGGVAEALNRLGGLLNVQQRPNEAAAALEESLRIYRELGNRRGIGSVLTSQAVLMQTQDPARASELLTEVLELARQRGATQTIGLAMVYLAESRFLAGDVAGALSLSEEGLALVEGIGNAFFIAGFQEMLGRMREGIDPEVAGRHYGVAGGIYRDIGDRRGLAKVALGEARIHFIAGDVEASRRRAAEALELSATLSNPLTQVAILGFLARLESAEGRWGVARTQALGALQILQEGQRASPLDEAAIHISLGRAQLALEQQEAARRSLAQAKTLATPAVLRPSLNESLEVLESLLLALDGRGEDAMAHLQRALDDNPPDLLQRRLELSVARFELETCLFPEADRRRNLVDVAETAHRSGFLRLAQVAESVVERAEPSPRLDICAAIKAPSMSLSMKSVP